MSSLFDRLGGEAAIDAAVDRFYEKVLNDDRIRHFFVGVDMDRQRGHQKRFLTYAFGGSPAFSGRSMRAAHKRLVDEMGLSDHDFDAVLEDLGDTLRELGVADDLIAEAATIAESARDDVLNR